MSLFIWNKYGDNRHKHSAFAYNAGTLIFAHDNYLAEKQKHPALKKGVYEEYYANLNSVYRMTTTPQEFTAMAIATDMYQNGVLNKSEYRDIISREGAEWSDRDNNAARHLRKTVLDKGIDAIVYMNNLYDSGSIGVIPLDESKLSLVSVNGVTVEDNRQSDSKEPAFFMPENDIENFVEKGNKDLLDEEVNIGYNEADIINDGSHLFKGKLKPNVKYKAGEYEYIYSTDQFGRISHVEVADLQYTERNFRKKHNSNTPEKEKGDHAGHLIGDRFGGSENIDNLVSQSARVNLSEFKKIENQWARAIKQGKKVSVDIEVKYDGDSVRPAEFIVKYKIDGVKFKRNIKN